MRREPYIVRKPRSGVLAALSAALLLAGAGVASAQPVFEEGFLESPEPLPDPCPDGAEVLAAQTPADRELEARVKGALSLQGFDRLTEIDVATIGTTVCLRGQAATPTDSERAEGIAARVRGVDDVVNRLQIPIAD